MLHSSLDLKQRILQLELSWLALLLGDYIIHESYLLDYCHKVPVSLVSTI